MVDDDRNARYAAAYHFAQMKLPDVKVADWKGFADLYADKYSAKGLTLDEALEDYQTG